MPAAGENPLLILLPAGSIGARVDLSGYGYQCWVRWPPAEGNGLNRLLSIPTGLDWAGHPGDFHFEPTGLEAHRSPNHARLTERGHFVARDRMLHGRRIVALRAPYRGVDPVALMLALDRSGQVRTLPLGAETPEDAVLVAAARNWDEASRFASMTKRRVLAVEFPPDPRSPWTRCWLNGRGWPEGLPMNPQSKTPGLVEARELLALLLQPNAFEWTRERTSTWPGANVWLRHIRMHGVLAIALLGLGIIYACAAAIVGIVCERRRPVVAQILAVLLLAPAAFVLSGFVTRWAGPSQWLWILALSWLGLALLAECLSFASSLAGSSLDPLYWTALVSTAVLASFDPMWSFFSPVLGHVASPASGAALGALGASIAGVVALSAQGSPIIRVASYWLPVGVVVSGAFVQVWWAGSWDVVFVLAIVALLGGRDVFGKTLRARPSLLWIMAVALLVLPEPLMQALRHGFFYSLNGLLVVEAQREAINLGRHMLFLISPGFLQVLLMILLAALFTDRFFLRQLRVLFESSLVSRALLAITAACLTMAVLRPYLLDATLPALAAFSLVLLRSGIRPA